jgi:hypothetical protein
MGKLRLSAAAIAAAALAMFALAACGGSDSSDDEDQISQAIEFAAASGDPKACTEAQTQNFTDQVGGGGETGAAAVKACEQNAAETVADSVDVSDIEVDGDAATAKAAVTGSNFDGQTLDLALVKEGDQWKVDEFKGFAEFNREALLAGFQEEIGADPSVSPEAKACVTQQLNAQSDDQLEAFFTGTDPQSEERIFSPCSRFFQNE